MMEGAETDEHHRRRASLTQFPTKMRTRTLSLGATQPSPDENTRARRGSLLSDTSHQSIPDHEQFIDGQARAGVNSQRPGYVRTFNVSEQNNSQYEANTMPNMAFLDREAGLAERRLSHSPPQRTYARSLEQLAPRTDRSSVSLKAHGASYDRKERLMQRTIGEMLLTDRNGQMPRGLGPIPDENDDSSKSVIREGPERKSVYVDLRKENLPRAYRADLVAEHPLGISTRATRGEETENNVGKTRYHHSPAPSARSLKHSYYVPRGSYPGYLNDMEESRRGRSLRPVNPDSSNSSHEYLARTSQSDTSENEGLSNRSHPQLQSTEHTPSRMAQLHSESSRRDLESEDPGTGAPPESIDPTHPSFRRQTITPSMDRYPSPLSRRFSKNNEDQLPSATPDNIPPKHRWYHGFGLLRLTGGQSANSAEGEMSFPTRLRRELAPAHWLLHYLLIILWSACIIYFLVRVFGLSKKLEFECYELKTQLHLLNDESYLKSTYATDSLNVTQAVNFSKSFVPSSLKIPSDVVSSSSPLNSSCVLTPVNQATILSSNFITIYMLGLSCCGIAFLAQAFCFRMFRTWMKRSGANGKATMIIRVASQIGCSAAAVGLVVGVAWSIAGRE